MGIGWLPFVALPRRALVFALTDRHLHVYLLLGLCIHRDLVRVPIGSDCRGVAFAYAHPLNLRLDVFDAIAVAHHNVGGTVYPTRNGSRPTSLIEAHRAGNVCIHLQMLHTDDRAGPKSRYRHRRIGRTRHIDRSFGRDGQLQHGHPVWGPRPTGRPQIMHLHARDFVVRGPQHDTAPAPLCVFEVGRIRLCVAACIGERRRKQNGRQLFDALAQRVARTKLAYLLFEARRRFGQIQRPRRRIPCVPHHTPVVSGALVAPAVLHGVYHDLLCGVGHIIVIDFDGDMPFVDGPQPNRRHGMAATAVRLIHPHGIQHLYRSIRPQTFPEHRNRRIGIQHMMMRPGRIGGLRRPPIGYLALQRHIACQHQLRSSLVPKRVRLQHPMIKVLTQHRHPFAVPRCHRAVERFHPDARRCNQRTRGCDAGAHLVAEHALQIGCGQIGDIARTIVFEPKSITLRRKPTRLHRGQRHILHGRLRTTPGQHEADEYRAPHPICLGHPHLVTIVSAQLG